MSLSKLHYRSLLRNRRGTAAIEFCFVAPILVTAFIGLTETTQVIKISLKLSHATNMLAKILAQQTQPIDQGQSASLGQMCKGASLTLSPFDTSKLSAVIGSYSNRPRSYKAPATQDLDWTDNISCPTPSSQTLSSDALAKAALLSPNSGDAWIVVQTQYIYYPVTNFFFPLGITLSSTAFQRSRNGERILFNAP